MGSCMFCNVSTAVTVTLGKTRSEQRVPASLLAKLCNNYVAKHNRVHLCEFFQNILYRSIPDDHGVRKPRANYHNNVGHTRIDENVCECTRRVSFDIINFLGLKLKNRDVSISIYSHDCTAWRLDATKGKATRSKLSSRPKQKKF